MNIALTADDDRKELLVQFCTAYSGLLREHSFIATSYTGKLISQTAGLRVISLMPGISGGFEQILNRISYGEVDMVLAFREVNGNDPVHMRAYTNLINACDNASIPLATNIATAEVLVQGLAHGDLDWRENYH